MRDEHVRCPNYPTCRDGSQQQEQYEHCAWCGGTWPCRDVVLAQLAAAEARAVQADQERRVAVHRMRLAEDKSDDLRGAWNQDVETFRAERDALATQLAARDAELAELRAALEFYADPTSWESHRTEESIVGTGGGKTPIWRSVTPMQDDHGARARRALLSGQPATAATGAEG